MQLIIEPIGERKLVANSEVINGTEEELYQHLLNVITELDLVDPDDDEMVDGFQEAICSLRLLVEWFNSWSDEWLARVTD